MSEAVALTRDAIRAALVGSRQEGASRAIKLFGIDIELRQPTFKSIMEARIEGDGATRAIDMIIKYAYVPGSEERIFEEGDIPQMEEWPFGPDLVAIQNAIVEMTGIDIAVEEATEELKDPLAE